MSDDDRDDLDQDEPDHIRDLRAQAKEAKELKARLAEMERDTAFTKALGPAADNPATKYFVKGYDGDLTVDAIKAAALEAGFLQTEPATPSPPDLDGHQRLAAAAAGAATPPRDDWQAALAEADRISDPTERENAILSVVERHGGVTSRTVQ